MDFVVEKIVLPKKKYGKTDSIPVKTDETLSQPTETLLCSMVSRIIKEMECNNHDRN